LKRLLVSALMSVVIYIVIAVGLIASQNSDPSMSGEGLDFDRLAKQDGNERVPVLSYQARDGARLNYRRLPTTDKDAALVVLLHGSGWHGQSYLTLAERLATKVNVIVPDLRGHGFNPLRRGDVDYIGQFEDDLADLIALEKRPGQKLILAGHSSGGGLVVRYAGGQYGDTLDRAILIAPFLKYNAPTTRENSGGWAQPLTRRIIGLTMLNNVGIGWLNHLTVIQFAFPPAVLKGPLGATATTAYSYRLNRSFAPRDDYLADVARLPDFLLLAGTDDEAFIASAYEPLLSSVHPSGHYILLPGIGHLDIIQAPAAGQAMLDFLN
jgi:pimeloyl-ACP methyl ester carboxylesterase